MTCCRMLLTASATPGSITFLQLAEGTATGLPAFVVIDWMMIGSQCTPRLAKVAYDSAIDRGVTSTEPSVNEAMVS